MNFSKVICLVLASATSAVSAATIRGDAEQSSFSSDADGNANFRLRGTELDALVSLSAVPGAFSKESSSPDVVNHVESLSGAFRAQVDNTNDATTVESSNEMSLTATSCGLKRSQTVYTGCGYTYLVKADRDKQCGVRSSTSKIIIDSWNGGDSCGLKRSQTVYTGCGYTYLVKADRDRQCGVRRTTSKIIFDSWKAPPTSCGLKRSQTVYTGCGYTYLVKADRDKQCGSGSATSKIIIDSWNEGDSCGLKRGQIVYTGCGYTYLVKADRDRQCGVRRTASKIIFDSWKAPSLGRDA